MYDVIYDDDDEGNNVTNDLVLSQRPTAEDIVDDGSGGGVNWEYIWDVCYQNDITRVDFYLDHTQATYITNVLTIFLSWFAT